MSYIKGSSNGAGKECILSREDYVLLSDKRTSTLSSKMREDIYDIFQGYERMKLRNREYDVTDIVIDLHHRLEKDRLQGPEMDFVYIDEFQDLTMSQISLFKYVCSNVDEGFVFSGDTAQTIARGIDFRFEDIRSLFYNKFLMGSRSEPARRTDKGYISDTFNLSRNFRTHTGILMLAQSVINLLYHFFPQSIDILKPETSLIFGEPPVFLEPCSDENAILSIFGDVKGSGSAMIGFGAEQVILVRDDDAKKEVCGYIGSRALVLTILECKGLEFQDVLLYNFFGSSPLRHQWRVVYELMKKENLLDSTFEKSYPSFNHARHSLMCSELKQLYVAITRTRQRLWISENSEEFSTPILDYWKKLGLVQLRVVDSSLVKAMQVASTVQEWQTRAIKLLWEENFEMAMLCFERAGDELGGKMAKAAALKVRARRLQDSKQDEMRLILREAGELYNAIGKADLAAECYIDIGDFETAGKIYLGKGGKYDLKKAGDCFMSAQSYQLAAESYAESHYFAECLSACVQGQLFDKGLCYIDSWKGNTTLNNEDVNWNADLVEIAQKFLVDCATKYHTLKNIQSMMRFVRAFDTITCKRSFLRSVGCLHELLQLEDESGNFVEASEIADELGNVPLQADFLVKGGRCKDSSSLILWHVFVNSLWNSGGGGWPLKQFPQKEGLLLKSESIAAQEGDILSGLVCTEVGLLSHEDHKLSTLGQYFTSSVQHQCLRGQYISIRKILDTHLQFGASNYQWEDELPGDLGKVSLQRISMDQISASTLFHFWHCLGEMIAKFHKCIQDISSKNFDDKDSVEFCLNYFGVRRRMNLEITEYQILIPDAQWVKKMNLSGSVRECGKFSFIVESALVSAVKDYWQAELITISLKVLDALQVLYNSFLVNSSLTVSRQSMCLLYIHKVTRFLQGCNLLKCKISDSKKFEKFRLLSHALLYKVFSLDCRLSLTRSMVYLRKNQDSQDLLSEIIHEVIKSKSSLTYGQIGKVMMICLGSGEITDELHGEIRGKFGEDIAWNDLFEACSDTRKLESQFENVQIGNYLVTENFPVNRELHLRRSLKYLTTERGKDSDGFSFISKFHKTLEDTYNQNWREIEDYIFPNCFIYLVDRLVLLSSCSQEVFFTTRSSLTESIMHKRLESYHCLEDSFRAYDFVVMIFRQLVLCREDFVEWVRRSNINPDNYIPFLLQRLVVLVALICLNSGRYYDILKIIFYDDNIRLPLSLEFFELLKLAMVGHDLLDPSVVEEALKLIEDPLVIVSLNGSSPNVKAPAAIIIGMDNLQSDDILDVLFPKEFPNRHVGSGEIPIPADGSSSNNVNFSAISKIEGKETSCERSMGIIFDWVSFQEIHKYVKADTNMEKLKCVLSDFKEKMEGSMTCLTAAMALSVNSHSHGGINYTDEMNNLLEDLNQLSSALESRNEELEGNVMQIKQLIERVLSRRPVLESFFNHVLAVDDKISCKKSEADAQCSKQDGVYFDAENWYTLPQDNNSKKQAAPGKGKEKGKGKGKGKSKGRKR